MNRDQYVRQRLVEMKDRKAARFSEKLHGLVFQKKATPKHFDKKAYTPEQIERFNRRFAKEIAASKLRNRWIWFLTIAGTPLAIYLLHLLFSTSWFK